LRILLTAVPFYDALASFATVHTLPIHRFSSRRFNKCSSIRGRTLLATLR
jgi:hypothetical protein